MEHLHGYRVKLDHKFPEKWSQYVRVRWHQLPHLVMLGIRYIFYWMYIKLQGRTPLMDYLHVQNGQQIYGVPIGGIGSGTIGRGFRGEFCRYQLRPGIYSYKTIAGNQFIVTIKNNAGTVVYQKVLSATKKPKNLSSWDWSYKGGDAEFVGLYPRSWTKYRIPEQSIVLTCRQVSPVIPDNYTDSCMPCAVFVWTVENDSGEDKSVSITFTFQNGVGEGSDKAGGCWSEHFHTAPSETERGSQGVLIHHSVGDMGYTFAIAAAEKEGVALSYLEKWNPLGSGDEVWGPLRKEGCFPPSNLSGKSPTSK